MLIKVDCEACRGSGLLLADDIENSCECPFCDGHGFHHELDRVKPLPEGKVILISTPTHNKESKT